MNYLDRAKEMLEQHQELATMQTEMKVQIACCHILMDEGQINDYQVDGFEIGKIIWNLTSENSVQNNQWFHLYESFYQYCFIKKGIEQSYFYDVKDNYFYYEFKEEGMVDIAAADVPDDVKRELAKHLSRIYGVKK